MGNRDNSLNSFQHDIQANLNWFFFASFFCVFFMQNLKPFPNQMCWGQGIRQRTKIKRAYGRLFRQNPEKINQIKCWMLTLIKECSIFHYKCKHARFRTQIDRSKWELAAHQGTGISIWCVVLCCVCVCICICRADCLLTSHISWSANKHSRLYQIESHQLIFHIRFETRERGGGLSSSKRAIEKQSLNGNRVNNNIFGYPLPNSNYNFETLPCLFHRNTNTKFPTEVGYISCIPNFISLWIDCLMMMLRCLNLWLNSCEHAANRIWQQKKIYQDPTNRAAEQREEATKN